jgi:DNA (cytosine-5)-methyltransferase 1
MKGSVRTRKRKAPASRRSAGRKSRRTPIANVVDLFCGAGGLSHGFLKEGFEVKAGIDLDEDCRYAFEHNNGAPFLARNITEMRGTDVSRLLGGDRPTVLVGCAPCQPFSVYNQKNEDPQWQLLSEFARLIRETRPMVVSMENVPALLRFRGGKVFQKFVRSLRGAGYHVNYQVAFAPDYGVGQQRSRLVLLASRLGKIELIAPTHSPERYKTVKDVIGKLPRLRAGGVNRKDAMHRSSGLSDLNLKRIKAAKVGGTWRDWDKRLVTACHQGEAGRGYSSVYGRMDWDAPSPTITTQFFGFGNGRFGHPAQHRALSLREGALLQSFPRRYAFSPPGKPVQFKKIGRMIGNAVPVLLARAIARSIRDHLEEHELHR